MPTPKSLATRWWSAAPRQRARAVRYAWDNYPNTANLYNAAGLQAAPFRTDEWDAMPPIEAQFTAK